MSTDHNFLRERRANADSNQSPSAYQPNALPLGQTGSPYVCKLQTQFLKELAHRKVVSKTVYTGGNKAATHAAEQERSMEQECRRRRLTDSFTEVIAGQNTNHPITGRFTNRVISLWSSRGVETK